MTATSSALPPAPSHSEALNTSDSAPKRGMWPVFALILAALLGFAWVFRLEWTTNDQYGYGLFIPPLVAWLLYRRWESRPDLGIVSRTTALIATGLLVCIVLGTAPFLLIYAANPEWRALLWLFALALVAFILGIALRLGGYRWMRHFLPPTLILLLAVPWPTQFETAVVGGLMEVVTIVVAQLLAFSGIYAQHAGNVIYLANGPVGVEEACSGIRSFQLGLATACIMGEFYRMAIFRRLFLVVFGFGVAMLVNFARTLTLTLLVQNGGNALMDEWHDLIGMITMLGTLFLIYAMGEILRQPRDVPPPPSARPTPYQPYQWKTASAFLAFPLIAFGLVEAHFAQNAPKQPTQQLVLAEDSLPEDWEDLEVPDMTRAQLRYSSATSGSWQPGPMSRGSMHLFTWDAGRVSSFVGVHRPESCLPSAGWTLKQTYPPIDFPIQDTHHTVEMTPYRFESNQGHVLYAYFGVWDHLGKGTLVTARTAQDRIQQALQGRRINGRQSLNIMILGPGHLNIEDTKEEALNMLACFQPKSTPGDS